MSNPLSTPLQITVAGFTVVASLMLYSTALLSALTYSFEFFDFRCLFQNSTYDIQKFQATHRHKSQITESL
jgi:hypothetical protein